jgi:hypothetical protein
MCATQYLPLASRSPRSRNKETSQFGPNTFSPAYFQRNVIYKGGIGKEGKFVLRQFTNVSAQPLYYGDYWSKHLTLKQLHGLRNAHRVSVHEVDVRMSLGKYVPLGRLQELVTP